MVVEVLIPQQGLTTEEVTIGELLKHSGDRVTVGEELLHMESEKAASPLESPVAGTIVAMCVQHGQTATVGAVACRIETGD